jgi:phosphopantothenoylcysteine decarboxylase/phosphopantothenate--cysteine ligase
MNHLSGKKILLGVSGSIAAYKAAFLTRLLIKSGAEVKVVMTEAATRFISPLTLSTLSTHPVHTDVLGEDGWNNHVEMGLWADAMVLAPVTASTLARLAHGQSDNLLVAVYLSARCPVFFAPAMDLDMWKHPATQRNVALLKEAGNHLIPVGHGELASGLVGDGRMAEPEDIVQLLDSFFGTDQPLQGRRFVVTAGPTYEPIDPVRFIGNHSSGKMGVAICEALLAAGASVDLVLGPSALTIDHPRLQLFRVKTAREMEAAAKSVFPDSDGAILSAAVADYRPRDVADQKIKKEGHEVPSIELTLNPDIAAELGKAKKAGQLLVGFALETQNEEVNAIGKMERKNFDFIVLNSLQNPGTGFHVDTNQVTIIHRDNKKEEIELKSKRAVADDIVRHVVSFFEKK